MEEERGNINRGTTGDATIARALTQHTLWSVNITLLLEMGCLPRGNHGIETFKEQETTQDQKTLTNNFHDAERSLSL